MQKSLSEDRKTKHRGIWELFSQTSSRTPGNTFYWVKRVMTEAVSLSAHSRQIQPKAHCTTRLPEPLKQWLEHLQLALKHELTATLTRRKPWENTLSILEFCVVPKRPGQVCTEHFKDWSAVCNATSPGPNSVNYPSHRSRQGRGNLLEELKEFAVRNLS